MRIVFILNVFIYTTSFTNHFINIFLLKVQFLRVIFFDTFLLAIGYSSNMFSHVLEQQYLSGTVHKGQQNILLYIDKEMKLNTWIY